jgi:hypothetical protein
MESNNITKWLGLIRISKSAELKGKNGKVPVSNYLSTTP